MKRIQLAVLKLGRTPTAAKEKEGATVVEEEHCCRTIIVWNKSATDSDDDDDDVNDGVGEKWSKSGFYYPVLNTTVLNGTQSRASRIHR